MKANKAKKAGKSFVQRLGKVVFIVLGSTVIFLAVGLGLFRLLVAQIPEYQVELKAWVESELDLIVDFAELDARLGFAGPELALRSASIGGSDGSGFLEAERAAITLDPVALVLGWDIEVSRLTLDRVRLTVVREPDGTIRFGDYSIDPRGGAMTESLLASGDVAIRDSQLVYVDGESDESWEFDDFELDALGSADGLDIRATMRPPERLAGRIDVEASAESDNESLLAWHIRVAADGLDLSEFAGFAALPLDFPISGAGKVDAELDWEQQRLVSSFLAVDLSGVAIDVPGVDDPYYDQLAFTADWQRAGEFGWQLGIDELVVARNGRSWAEGAFARVAVERDIDGIRAFGLDSAFIRLDDLTPFVMSFPETQLAAQWELFEPRGDLRDLSFSLERLADDWDYELGLAFDRIAVRQVGQTPGIDGLSGDLTARAGSGTIDFSSGAFSLDWPALFPRSMSAQSLTGAVVWRQATDFVRINSVDLALGVLDDEIMSSFELTLPQNGESATLDLDAKMAEVPLEPAKRYLPTGILPDGVVAWLEQAIVGGSAHNVELSFVGPIESFPFDDDRGRFRVAADVDGVTLDYMPSWPPAEEVAGRIEFVNAGFDARGAGRVLSNVSEDIAISIPDMRAPVMTLTANTSGPLEGVAAYLRGASLIAEQLGPAFERLGVSGGIGAIDARLELPLLRLSDYTLDASLAITDGTLGVAGLGPEFSEIDGVISVDESSVSADAVDAVFLGGPAVISLTPSDASGYRAVLDFEGETAVESALDAFSLPYEDLFAGQAIWHSELMLPALDSPTALPQRITIESNLAGIAIRLPEPLAKAPAEPTNFAVDLRFEEPDRLEISGNLGATRRFELSFVVDDEKPRFVRGAIQFGGDEPRLPVRSGILVDGRLPALELDQWLVLASRTGMDRVGPLFLGADLDVSDLRGFGQHLGMTRLRIERETDVWDIELDSEAIAGEIRVPRDPSQRGAVVAEMSRVYLATGAGGSLTGIDPRTLPGLRLRAGEFGFGNRQLGRVEATIVPDPEGLRLTGFASATESLVTNITGSWLQGPAGPRTSVDAQISSTDVQTALRDLGLDPVIAGESALVAASVHWDEAPSAEWLDHLNGNVSLYVETGSLREIDPGAGRVVGLMSIAALPRRLTLDFRDVFEEGFAFDEISGTFQIIDGDAYTNDLKFAGPGADIGVVGRTGLRDRDYQQQIVVTAEPGNVLPTVGGLLGGAGVGAALLIFTRLFKEPLKGIGRASYCLGGSWEEPLVERIDNDNRAAAASCAAVPAQMLDDTDG